MISPRISVVVPMLNAAAFVEAALSSIVSQRYPNVELIIVDGGSSDGSLELVEAFRDDVDILISESDAGHYDAVNKGFAAANGDIYCCACLL